MITKILRLMVSCGAQTQFEKSRIQATYDGDTEPPDENNIQIILNSLGGNDSEISAIGSLGMITNSLKSDKIKWVFAMKSLLILDRSVDRLILLQYILNLELKNIETFKCQQPIERHLLIDQLIQNYYRYIKLKSYYYQKIQISLVLHSRNKKSYFKDLNVTQILQELSMCLELMEYAMDVADTEKRGHLRFKLNQYVFLLLLKDLLNLYSSISTAFSCIMNNIFNFSYDEIDVIQSMAKEFNKYSTKIQIFLQQHPYIDGFTLIDTSVFNKINFSDVLVGFQNCIKDKTLLEDNLTELVLNGEEDIRFITSTEDLSPKTEIGYRTKVTRFDEKIQDHEKINFQFANLYDESLFKNFENNFIDEYKTILVQKDLLKPDYQYDQLAAFVQQRLQSSRILENQISVKLIIPNQEGFNNEIFKNHINTYSNTLEKLAKEEEYA